MVERMIQVELRDRFADPDQYAWAQLVACVCLNRTGGRTVRKVLPRLFAVADTPEKMARLFPHQLVEILEPLGFQNQKSSTVVMMSRAWIQKGTDSTWHWQEIMDLPGVGQYAADSWRIFVQKDLTEPEPKDKSLRVYWHQNRIDTRGSS